MEAERIPSLCSCGGPLCEPHRLACLLGSLPLEVGGCGRVNYYNSVSRQNLDIQKSGQTKSGQSISGHSNIWNACPHAYKRQNLENVSGALIHLTECSCTPSRWRYGEAPFRKFATHAPIRGSSGVAGVFVWQAASSTRPVARVARWRDASRLSQSCVSSGRRRTRLNLSVLARFS